MRVYSTVILYEADGLQCRTIQITAIEGAGAKGLTKELINTTPIKISSFNSLHANNLQQCYPVCTINPLETGYYCDNVHSII